MEAVGGAGGRKRLVGLTGNIATGKSTVARMLAGLGATVIDADRVAHEAMAPGTAIHAAIVEAFGPQVVGPEGQIDRARLGAHVFADPAALERLERVVHPAVIAAVAQRVAAAPPGVVVIEAIKLIEAGMADGCDSLWVTTCPAAAQVKRLMDSRGLNRTEAELRVSAQPPQAEKIVRADVVIDTGGSMAETQAQVEAAWARLDHKQVTE